MVPGHPLGQMVEVTLSSESCTRSASKLAVNIVRSLYGRNELLWLLETSVAIVSIFEPYPGCRCNPQDVRRFRAIMLDYIERNVPPWADRTCSGQWYPLAILAMEVRAHREGNGEKIEEMYKAADDIIPGEFTADAMHAFEARVLQLPPRFST